LQRAVAIQDIRINKSLVVTLLLALWLLSGDGVEGLRARPQRQVPLPHALLRRGRGDSSRLPCDCLKGVSRCATRAVCVVGNDDEQSLRSS